MTLRVTFFFVENYVMKKHYLAFIGLALLIIFRFGYGAYKLYRAQQNYQEAVESAQNNKVSEPVYSQQDEQMTNSDDIYEISEDYKSHKVDKEWSDWHAYMKNIELYKDVVEENQFIQAIDKEVKEELYQGYDIDHFFFKDFDSSVSTRMFNGFFERYPYFTDQEREKIEKRISNGDHSWYTLKSEFGILGTHLTWLEKEFGKESRIFKLYKKKYVTTGNLILAIKTLLPKEMYKFKEADERNQIYGLLRGVRLTKNQASVVSKIIKREIGATPAKYKNIVLIDAIAGNYFVKTVKGVKRESIKNLLEDTPINSSTLLLLKGDRSDELNQLAENSGAKVSSFKAYIESTDNFR